MTNVVRTKSPLKYFQGFCDFIQPSLVEDILKSSEYWPGNTETCRICFKSLFDTVKNQGLFLRDIERIVHGKVNVTEFHNGLAAKADFLTVCEKLNELKGFIDKKTSINDVELCVNLAHKPGIETFKGITDKLEVEIGKRVENKEFLETVNRINAKVQMALKDLGNNQVGEFGGLKEKIECVEEEFKILNMKIGNIENNLQGLNTKIGKIGNIEDYLKELNTKIGNIEKNQKNMQELNVKIEKNEEIFQELNTKIGKIGRRLENFENIKENFSDEPMRFSFGHQLDSQKQKISEIFNKKADTDKMQEQFSALTTKLQETSAELHKKLESFHHYCLENYSRIPSKSLPSTDLQVFKEEVCTKLEKIHENIETLWKSKPEKSEIRAALHEINQKLHTKLIQLTKPLKSDIDPEYSPVKNMKTLKPAQEVANFAALNKNIEEIKKELLLKASVKDLCVLLDMKANVEDVNLTLLGIHKELDCNNSIFPQGIWSFYSEKNAKLVYKTVKKSELLMCEFENFRIVIGKSGFYEVKVVIFTENNAKAQVLKNGEQFLVIGEKKIEGFGMKIQENVELLQGDVLEIAVPVALLDLRGYLMLFEIIM